MTPELKKLYSKLTRFEKDICSAKLDGLNHEDAYRDAGKTAASPESARSAVSRLLTNVNVKAFMDAADEEAVSSMVMSKREAIERLSVLARGNVSDLVEFRTIEIETADGPAKQSVWALKDGVELDAEQMSIISELSAGKDGFKFKTHSSTQAAAQLAKMLGWEAPTKVAQTDTEGKDIDDSPRETMRKLLFTLELLKQTEDNNQGQQL